ncbi:LLM class flavin-dependent oxidoreductase [Paenibacillus yanchengensis]|uniref:LLM class flavin-dependent oxidoreductase n=1 Tax=Paenibacillus yanchengensis TaxID=2035833 RepID=A0ABW4YM61_9BACL
MTNNTINKVTVPVSILDVSPIVEGGTIAQSLHNTIDLAQHAEKWGYHRFWLAEHHSMPNIASSATSVVIAHVASQTNKIRVGSGGIMLPNHSPLVIAEQFGTLDAFHPGRIDLGLGRAPGTDQVTATALRGARGSGGHDFPEQLELLRTYFDPSRQASPPKVRAFPGEGTNIPIWLLGSSDFSAMLSAQQGLPFSFAGHFSPNFTVPAMNLYRNNFTASEDLQAPYAMAAVNVIAADTDEQAEYLATSMKQLFVGIFRNARQKLQPPVDSLDHLLTPQEKILLDQQLGSSIIGSKATVAEKLQQYIDATKADEIMIASYIYDHDARLRSYEIIGQLIDEANTSGLGQFPA